jgi:hypothetical protein
MILPPGIASPLWSDKRLFFPREWKIGNIQRLFVAVEL